MSNCAICSKELSEGYWQNLSDKALLCSSECLYLQGRVEEMRAFYAPYEAPEDEITWAIEDGRQRIKDEEVYL